MAILPWRKAKQENLPMAGTTPLEIAEALPGMRGAKAEGELAVDLLTEAVAT